MNDAQRLLKTLREERIDSDGYDLDDPVDVKLKALHDARIAWRKAPRAARGALEAKIKKLSREYEDALNKSLHEAAPHGTYRINKWELTFPAVSAVPSLANDEVATLRKAGYDAKMSAGKIQVIAKDKGDGWGAIALIKDIEDVLGRDDLKHVKTVKLHEGKGSGAVNESSGKAVVHRAKDGGFYLTVQDIKDGGKKVTFWYKTKDSALEYAKSANYDVKVLGESAQLTEATLSLVRKDAGELSATGALTLARYILGDVASRFADSDIAGTDMLVRRLKEASSSIASIETKISDITRHRPI